MSDTNAPPRQGRPRSKKAEDAILAAAIELLLDRGLRSMSMDDVAARAGVSKATIYRWWTSKELLALDALATEWAAPPTAATRDTGSLSGDLIARLRPWLRQLNAKPYARVIAGLLSEAQTDPAFAALYQDRFLQPRRDALRPLFARAVGRREIAATTDIDLTLDLLYGPIYHRLLQGHAPLSDRFARQVVDATVRAISVNGIDGPDHPAPQR